MHVDRVRLLSSKDKQVKLADDASRPAELAVGKKKAPVERAALRSQGSLGQPVEHYSAEDDFSAFIESASESEEEDLEPVGQIAQPAPPAPAAAPVARLTRGAAARSGISVPEISLPSRCWASSSHQRRT